MSPLEVTSFSLTNDIFPSSLSFSSIIIIIISESPFFHLNHNLSLFVSSCCFSQQCSLSLTFFSLRSLRHSRRIEFCCSPVVARLLFSSELYSGILFSSFFYLFIHSKWFVCLLCFPSIFHNSWNTLRFFCVYVFYSSLFFCRRDGFASFNHHHTSSLA